MFKHVITSAITCPIPCIGLGSNNDSDDLFPDETINEPVLLNIYDMYGLNECIGNIGLGIFHSGVQVYGKEYGFAGHRDHHTGIFDILPKDQEVLEEYLNLKGRLRFKQTIVIGYTNYNPEEVKIIKNRLGKKFRGNKYNLITNNCNHFSAAFTKALCNKDIPPWINRLAQLSSHIPFVHRIVPKNFLGPDFDD